MVCSCTYRRMLCRAPGDRFVNVPLCTYELYALKSITFNFLHFHIFFGCPESGNSSTQPQDMALLFPSLSCSPMPHALPPHNTRCMGIRQRRRRRREVEHTKYKECNSSCTSALAPVLLLCHTRGDHLCLVLHFSFHFTLLNNVILTAYMPLEVTEEGTVAAYYPDVREDLTV